MATIEPQFVPGTTPLQLWAFLENSDFQRYKNGALFRQDEVALIRHDRYLESDYQLLADIRAVLAFGMRRGGT